MTEFWGVEFQHHSKKETLKIVNDCLVENKVELFIATLNPELLLLSEKDEYYRKILNSANLKNVDGFGVKLMGWFKNRKVSDRFAGVDLAGHILKIAIKNNLRIAFVLRKDGLSNSEDLKKLCDQFLADVKCIEYDINKEGGDDEINMEIQDREVVLVGLGAPYQERFIFKNQENWPSLKLAIGVGGTFDFWIGKQKRSPIVMRKIGLEWLWRLVTRPKRFWKIWRSTVVFMLKSLIK